MSEVLNVIRDYVEQDEKGRYFLHLDVTKTQELWDAAQKQADEVERLQRENAAWSEKAKTWLASPAAAQRLDGYMELTSEVERLVRLLARVEKHFGGPPLVDPTCDLEAQFSTEHECDEIRLRIEVHDAVIGKEGGA